MLADYNRQYYYNVKSIWSAHFSSLTITTKIKKIHTFTWNREEDANNLWNSIVFKYQLYRNIWKMEELNELKNLVMQNL